MNLLEEYSESELRLINASLLPLAKKRWAFTRGARTEQKYLDGSNVNAREYYTYIWSEDNRRVLDFTRTFRFQDDEGNLLFDEIDTTPDKDDLVIDEINESIRIRQVRYLRSATKRLREAANSLPPQVDQETLNVLIQLQHVHPYYSTPELYTVFRDGLLAAADGLDFTLGYYSVQINLYEKYGTLDFENAINNETNETVLSILNSTLSTPDADFPNGLTGLGSIMYQLRGIVP